eukprot:TRINITY_DN1570_c0_g1_i4.p1 TRINITY_DN1570_c0_g1~~TRINITY_DN1570_c0_g1_i4.p1  ORF type:complete len:101 (+),score=22.25 TRINITY_DN1570_c0_g1_i4:149-451(+)
MKLIYCFALLFLIQTIYAGTIIVTTRPDGTTHTGTYLYDINCDDLELCEGCTVSCTSFSVAPPTNIWQVHDYLSEEQLEIVGGSKTVTIEISESREPRKE